VLPFAVATVHINTLEDADAVPGLTSEFFAPVVIVAHLSSSDSLTRDHLTTITKMADAASAPAVATLPGPAAPAGEAGDTPASTEEATATRALARTFLERATALVNGHLWGNLVAILYVDSRTIAALDGEVSATVDALEYGTIAVNTPSLTAFQVVTGMWGGFQDESTSMVDARSGVGVVYNALNFDHPQKQAVWNDFGKQMPSTDAPLPAWVAKPLIGIICNGYAGLWQALTR
jgi:hypothetical protein